MTTPRYYIAEFGADGHDRHGFDLLDTYDTERGPYVATACGAETVGAALRAFARHLPTVCAAFPVTDPATVLGWTWGNPYTGLWSVE